MKLDENVDKRRDVPIIIDGETCVTGFEFIGFKLQETNEFKYLMSYYPNFASMFLNISENNYAKAKDIFYNIITKKLIDKGSYYELDYENSESLLYDFYELIFISVIFAHSAIEALVNSLIPNSLKLFKEKKDNEFIFMSKSHIERNRDLEYKVSRVLPVVYYYNFIKADLPFWSSFKLLLKFRNEIIHLKSQEIKGNKSIQTALISNFIVEYFENDVGLVIRELFKYLKSKIHNVPGFPSEFEEKPINLENYLKHYSSKEIDFDKREKYDFSCKEDLELFVNVYQKNIGNKIKITILK